MRGRGRPPSLQHGYSGHVEWNSGHVEWNCGTDEMHYGNDVPMTVGVDWSMEKEGA